MMLRRIPFKLALPALYFLCTALFVGGIIITIAEGPNPFGFLYDVVLYPAALVDFVLPTSTIWSQLNGWILLLFGVFLNLLIYFLVGFLIDYLIGRKTSAPVARR